MNAPSEFEWDDAKAESNLAKHGVPFEYAIQVFLDETCICFDASRLEQGEFRNKAVGMVDGRLFVFVFTMRGTTCRIISARRANALEEKRYGS
ncbi:BrnT family toxin [Microvirga sp. M2]|uniref:BrnT family toxin n=1 Tax=Microvirga sp. M2 TaxID=3073270 RepID=UPI0039C2140F